MSRGGLMNLAGKRIYVENLGCAKNQVDAEVMLHELSSLGCKTVFEANEADIILVNTCGFIESARKESIDTFFQLRNRYPDKKVVMTGCLSQRYAVDIADDLQEADGMYGNRDLRQIGAFLEQVIQGSRPVITPPYPAIDRENDTRDVLLGFPGSAYLKISEGCNHRCRYCAIPLIRGPLRSRPMDAVVQEAKRLIGAGTKEINLIAQDLASYGTDWDQKSSRFIELLSKLVAIEGDYYIRMLYIHPDSFPTELPAFVANNPKIIPYFDIPFQHAAESVLKPMGRTGNYERYLALIDAIRKELPDATIRSTFMLGFTGDSPQAFNELKQFVKAAELDWVGTFLYSREEGTPAFDDLKLRQYQAAIRQARKDQKELLEIQESITKQRLQRFIGRIEPVLIEEPIDEEDLAIGRIMHQAPEVDGSTVVMGRNLKAGTLVFCAVRAVNGFDLDAVAKDQGGAAR